MFRGQSSPCGTLLRDKFAQLLSSVRSVSAASAAAAAAATVAVASTAAAEAAAATVAGGRPHVMSRMTWGLRGCLAMVAVDVLN